MPQIQPITLQPESRYKFTQAVVDANNRTYFQPWERDPMIDTLVEGSDKYVVRDVDIGRLDLIAYHFYDNVYLWWLIAAVNNLTDQVTDMYAGQVIYIPNRQDAERIMARKGAYYDENVG